MSLTSPLFSLAYSSIQFTTAFVGEFFLKIMSFYEAGRVKHTTHLSRDDLQIVLFLCRQLV
jgi:hypothetical protein